MSAFAMYFTSIKWWSIKIFFAFVIALPLQAQVQQNLRYEIPLPGNEREFEIIPADTSGLYIFRSLYSAKNDHLHLIRLDTAFHEKWSGYLSIEKNYLLVGKRSFEDKLYLLFRYHDYTRNDLIVFSIEHASGNYIRYVIKGFIPFAPTEFQLTKTSALVGGYFNRVPVVLHFSFLTSKSKVLPGLFNEAGELNQVRTYADGSFDVLISAVN